MGRRRWWTPSHRERRAQSHVVGIALLLGITVIALVGLTAGIGTMVEHNAGAADAERVADGIQDVYAPSETTGTTSGVVHLSGGELRTETRTIRLLAVDDESGVPGLGTIDPEHEALDPIERVETDVLWYENDHRTVTTGGGAVLVGGDGGARFHRPPAIHAGPEPSDPLLIGIPAVDAGQVSIGGNDRGTRLRIGTTVDHERQSLNASEYRLAIETERPGVWERHFEAKGLPVTTVDADGPTVVVGLAGDGPAYLVVHRTELEVTVG